MPKNSKRESASDCRRFIISLLITENVFHANFYRIWAKKEEGLLESLK
jgi:hypothetical protein